MGWADDARQQIAESETANSREQDSKWQKTKADLRVTRWERQLTQGRYEKRGMHDGYSKGQTKHPSLRMT